MSAEPNIVLRHEKTLSSLLSFKNSYYSYYVYISMTYVGINKNDVDAFLIDALSRSRHTPSDVQIHFSLVEQSSAASYSDTPHA
jgi:hypothetical protein